MTTIKSLCRPVFRIAVLAAALAALLCIAGIGASEAFAATVTTDDGFTIDRSYSYGSYTVSVKSYSGKGGDITLPEKAEINGTEYTITTIGGAFKNNELITSVTVPEGYTDIDSSAFTGCTKLESISLPGTLSSISANAFEGCTELKNVAIAQGDAGLTFRNAAFLNCSALKSFVLPARTSYIDGNIFRGCTALTTLTVADGCETYFSDGNIVYEKNDTGVTLLAYPAGMQATEYTVPSEVNGQPVTAIGAHTFRDNTTITKVILPASIATLERYCFNNCSSLKTVILNCTEAPTIGSSAFTGLAEGSSIYTANETVAAAFESDSIYTPYYDASTTVVTVGSGPEPEPETTSAALSVNADGVVDGNAVFNIALDSASHVNTLLIRLSFDKSQVTAGIVTELEGFSKYVEWDDSGDVLTAKIMLYLAGNNTGFSCSEQTKIAQIAVPVISGQTGRITMTVENALVSGIPDVQEDAVKGEVTITSSSAQVSIANYDVNGDGSVDQVDITEAQRYYQASADDADWNTASKADVNLDNIVDIQDFIDIFHHIDF